MPVFSYNLVKVMAGPFRWSAQSVCYFDGMLRSNSSVKDLCRIVEEEEERLEVDVKMSQELTQNFF